MTIVTVTGASGYVASELVRLLLHKGYHVKATVRSLQNKDKVCIAQFGRLVPHVGDRPPPRIQDLGLGRR